ncbi:MAG: alpha-L-rhamnosidase C-terminal domain-containing protein [Mangrovibacterium sp.]|nr:alpha-L-rhamnosidase C-terminal domain-containing protein [Mangrovibacterium sp.]
MKRKLHLMIFLLAWMIFPAAAQLPPVFDETAGKLARSSALTRTFLTPARIVWLSDTSGKEVQNAQSILNKGTGQADLNQGKYLTLVSTANHQPGIILDFGKEIHGGIEIVTTISNANPAGRIRIRLGESVSETMSDAGKTTATNDHAMRDFVVTLPWLGRLEVGESGFRFVRIDLVDPDTKLEIKEINAVFTYRDIPYLGSFRCNDERLNQIWMTGAYTVHLNMQNYLWDGIKRDRLVWLGDMHPEVMTVNSVFGYNEVVPKSLDLARDLTPLPNWMNGISSYSMWWILIHRDWYYYQGDLDYLKQQREYLNGLLRLLASKIDAGGKEILDGNRFLDWPSSENQQAVHAGLQSLMMMTFDAGAELCTVLQDQEMARFCGETAEKLRKHIPGMAGSKQAAALLAMSGLVSPEKANSEMLAQKGAHGMSTFYGYYMLNARAMAGDYQGALDNIREYWGGMLNLGATTFWEDFDIDWMKNAARIDELVPQGKTDVHGAYGNYCYKGYRHSLCHGWASGPTSWLTQYVLGVNVLEPGCRKISIEPHLGDLEWVKGTFPTPHGLVKIEHRKMDNGKIKTTLSGPKEVKIN